MAKKKEEIKNENELRKENGRAKNEKRDDEKEENDNSNNRKEDDEKELSIDEIKKLPPKERIEQLKKLEEKKKKEEEKIKREKEEAEKILGESIKELEIEDEIRETEERPKQSKTKTSEDEKNDLEDTIKKEKIKERILVEEARAGPDYGVIKQLTSPGLYQNLDRWQRQAEKGTLSGEYEETIKQLYEQVTAEYTAVKAQMEKGETLYQKNEEMLDKLISARKMLKDIGYKTDWFRRR